MSEKEKIEKEKEKEINTKVIKKNSMYRLMSKGASMILAQNDFLMRSNVFSPRNASADDYAFGSDDGYDDEETGQSDRGGSKVIALTSQSLSEISPLGKPKSSWSGIFNSNDSFDLEDHPDSKRLFQLRNELKNQHSAGSYESDKPMTKSTPAAKAQNALQVVKTFMDSVIVLSHKKNEGKRMQVEILLMMNNVFLSSHPLF
jgi:hypothetical protein